MFLFLLLILFLFSWIYINYLYNKCFYKIKKSSLFIYFVLGLICFFLIYETNTILKVDFIENIYLKFLVVSFVEEGIKILSVLTGIYYTTKISNQYIKSDRDIDFIVLNIVLVFSFLENLLYFYSFNEQLYLIMRILISTPIHIICTLIFAYSIYNKNYIKVLLPLIIHTTYNVILNSEVNIIILLSFLGIICYITIDYIIVLVSNIKNKKGYLYDRIYEFEKYKLMNEKFNNKR